ncbi:hypothetical protein VCRA2126O85_240039 [Vibrio crassostreae]|nr:hypothetical protein VCRA2128O106_220037 [Vibrio crassostreae]CAK2768567.1 hypothetical protein VCRA2128O100_240036 [Vibrio crassostreae]CAK2768753.1 hypothetical protein VCRA2125O83_220043 [Vibrio crassostreae]CAK2774175.1 hypothetical protein VCRA2127O91_240043 [Vibrio crassostreae]CAK2778966.1 hypothetical protein VCRA2126O85_240039 [Vibrio crassostreae]
MSAFKKLVEHSQKCSRFQHLASICGWEQVTTNLCLDCR